MHRKWTLIVILLAVLLFAAGCTQSTMSPGTAGTSSGVSGQGNPETGASANPDAVTWINKAWSLNAQGKFQDAMDAGDKAAAIDPTAAGLSFNRGWSLAGLGRYQDALTALDQATDENPYSEIAWSNKGFVLSHLGMCGEAQSAYDQALAIDPGNIAIREDLKSVSATCVNSGVTASVTSLSSSPESAAMTTVAMTTVPMTTTPTVPPQAATVVTMNPTTVVDLGSVWTVKEYGDMGNYDGIWTRQKGTDTFDASWSNGAITDVIDIQSVTGNTITLYRHGLKGTYTGTISPDGRSITGTASWYDAGETWTVTIV